MSALKDCSTVRCMKSLIEKRFSQRVIELLNATFPRAGYIAGDVGCWERVDTEGHMRAYFFHTVGKLDWPFSLGVRMRFLSCWLANRSHHLPSTRVCGRTNTTGTRPDTRISNANHLHLNVCEVEFRRLWRGCWAGCQVVLHSHVWMVGNSFY